jgi:bifunctional DNA-binding transcriptional regulator/antitoxin component of YhaV-PrlF toxin-antitoxin module
MSKKFIVTLEEDAEGNLVCPIPDEILEHLGLEEGDLLDYEVDGESIILTPIVEE